jgi:prepilin-type N-terminal cleavage/methylation domain-containing protein
MKGLKNQSGFTLIELVIVIVVLGILGAVAMIQFGNITQNARDASLQGMAGAYGAQLAIAVNSVGGLPTGGATVAACLPAPGTSTRFVDCVYNMVPNPTSTSIQRSTYDAAANAFNICSGAATCSNLSPATLCTSTSERFVRVTYTAATGALTIAAPANCT